MDSEVSTTLRSQATSHIVANWCASRPHASSFSNCTVGYMASLPTQHLMQHYLTRAASSMRRLRTCPSTAVKQCSVGSNINECVMHRAKFCVERANLKLLHSGSTADCTSSTQRLAVLHIPISLGPLRCAATKTWSTLLCSRTSCHWAYASREQQTHVLELPEELYTTLLVSTVCND